MNENRHKEASERRDRHTSDVLASQSDKVVVVAGPGTGKTFLFSRILEKHDGKATLTLSFINALVNDLSLGLCGLSDVRTLHGFALASLSEARGKSFKIFPKLSAVIARDAALLLEREIDFETMFQTGEVNQEDLEFYKARKDLYGTFYGFSDAVFAIVTYLDSKPDEVPSFAQVVVDEFQDFNSMEVRLIEHLSTRSPIVVAGDDDQSLYADLKNASPDFIRSLHGPARPEFEAFSLPFCSRSTEVIVAAVNDITQRAQEAGLLEGRVQKPYEYFTSAEKDKESADSPRILHANVYENQIPYFVKEQVCKIARSERRKISVLVIVPPQLKNRLVPKYTKKLREKGFSKIAAPRAETSTGLDLLAGLELLMEDANCELGWRIAAESLYEEEAFRALLEATAGADRTKVSETLSEENRRVIRKYVSSLKKIKKGESPILEDLEELLEALGINAMETATDRVREELQARRPGEKAARELGEMEIAVTTIPSSKGLSADYVFITHFDEVYYSTNGVVGDQDVYKLLVALTRAKKRVYLISTRGANQLPTLLDWIDSTRVEHI